MPPVISIPTSKTELSQVLEKFDEYAPRKRKKKKNTEKRKRKRKNTGFLVLLVQRM